MMFNPSVRDLLKLIQILSLIPPLIFSYLLYRESDAVVEFSRAELDGANLLLGAAHLPDLLMKGVDVAAPEFEKLKSQTRFDLKAVGNVPISFEGLAAFSVAVADASNLTLDPELDTFYLMDASTVQIPELMATLNRLGNFSRTPVAELTVAAESEQVVIDKSRVKILAAKIQSDLVSSAASNADGTVQPLQEAADKLVKDADALIINMDGVLRQIRAGEATDMAALNLAATQMIMDSDALWVRILDTKKALIEVRIAKKLRATYLSFALGFSVLGVSLLVGWLVNGKILRILGSFSDSFGQRIQRIAGSSVGMKQTVASMVAASEETSTQSKIVRSNSEVAANAVVSVNASIQEISSSVNETSEFVKDVVGKANHTSSVIVKLKDATVEIDSVVKLINDLATQTNLLALNAAIEAARAGDAGRGFAVVADEVTKLATHTRDATVQIGEQVAGIQSVAETAVTVLNELVRSIQSIQSNSSSVSSAIEEQTTVANNITQAANEAGSSVERVNVNMSGIEQAANDTSQAASDVAQSSATMASIVTELEQVVSTTLKAFGVTGSSKAPVGA